MTNESAPDRVCAIKLVDATPLIGAAAAGTDSAKRPAPIKAPVTGKDKRMAQPPSCCNVSITVETKACPETLI
jgi:hypothetical protein